MDVVTYAAARVYAETLLKNITKINFKNWVNYEANLPEEAVAGDAYIVRYDGTTGTVPNGQVYIKTNAGWVKSGYSFQTLLDLKQNKLTVGRGLKLNDTNLLELSISTFDIKGSKNFYADLPTDPIEGDTWYVKNNDADLTHTKGWYCWIEDGVSKVWQKIDSDTQWGKIPGEIAKQTDLMELLNKKQDTLTEANAGDNIKIQKVGGVIKISATLKDFQLSVDGDGGYGLV